VKVSIDELFSKLKYVRLAEDTEIKPFDCENKKLNTFIETEAKVLLKVLGYTTTLLEIEDKTVAYYSLANDLLISHDGKELRRRFTGVKNKIHHELWELLLSQKHYPAVKIGRLAVHKDFQRSGIGSFMLNSLTESFLVKNKTGCQFLTVDALNTPCVTSFYKKNGFENLLENTTGDTMPMCKSLLKYLYNKQV